MSSSLRALAFATLACACSRPVPEHDPVQRAELGVFFGGQVQQLRELKKEVDPTRQSFGFRLTFGKPLAADLPVSWELSLPELAEGGPRPASVGRVWAKAGQATLDVLLPFRATDPLGSWRARVTVSGKQVLERDFELYDPRKPRPTPDAGLTR